MTGQQGEGLREGGGGHGRTPEADEPDVVEVGEVVALHVVAVEVVEEAREPADHDLVVVPAVDELLEEVLVVVVAQGGST